MTRWLIDNVWLVTAVVVGLVVGGKVLLWRWFSRLTARSEDTESGSR